MEQQDLPDYKGKKAGPIPPVVYPAAVAVLLTIGLALNLFSSSPRAYAAAFAAFLLCLGVCAFCLIRRKN